jgi:hypothetical protein
MNRNFTRLLKTNTYYSLIFSLTLFACQSSETASESENPFNEAIPAVGDDFYLNVTKSSGINFQHAIGDDHLTNIIESVGGGGAFLDFDQDGFMDLYMANGSFHNRLSDQEYEPEKIHTNQLFRNNGDGTFQDVTKKAGVGHKGYGMGVTIGDFNNDGYPDIYASNHGPNVLY